MRPCLNYVYTLIMVKIRNRIPTIKLPQEKRLQTYEYIESRGFLPTVTFPSSRVYQYPGIPSLVIFVFSSSKVKLYADDHFTHPLYDGDPALLEFKQIIDYSFNIN